jgi:hypothetical protein
MFVLMFVLMGMFEHDIPTVWMIMNDLWQIWDKKNG